MKIKLGKVFKGIGKALGGIAKSLFRGKLFNILGKVLKFIPGLNLGGILGSALKVLGSASKVQNFLQVGRQVFEALRGKHRIDDRVRDLPAPPYPPLTRNPIPGPRLGDIARTLPARVDPDWIRRILDGLRRLPRPAPESPTPPIWGGPAIIPGKPSETPPIWEGPARVPEKLPAPHDIIQPLADLGETLRRVLDDIQEKLRKDPLLAPFFPFPFPGRPPIASADVGPALTGMMTELSRWLGGGHPAPGETQPPVIIR